MDKDIKLIDGQKSFEIKTLLDKKRLGIIIRQSILSRYDSLRQFSKFTGYPYGRVKAWASGRQIPVLYDFIVLSRVLMIPIENLLEASTENKMEYLNDEENIGVSEDIKKAIFSPPTINFTEVALLLPYLGDNIFCDLVCRVIDNSDNFYVFQKFSSYISSLYNALGGKFVIIELMNRCSPLIYCFNKFDFGLSEDRIDYLKKLIEEISLPDITYESDYIKQIKDYYLIEKYYKLTKKGYLVYKDEFNEYIKEHKDKTCKKSLT